MFSVEGVGDEVLYAFIALAIITILSLAWLSTGWQPFIYNFWLVQMQTRPHRRVLQVTHLEDEEAHRMQNEIAAAGRSNDAMLVTTSRIEHSNNSAALLTRWQSRPGASTVSGSNGNDSPSANVTRLQVEIQVDYEDLCPTGFSVQEVNPLSSIPSSTDEEDSGSSAVPSSSTVEDRSDVRTIDSTTIAETIPADAPSTTIRLKFLDDTHRQVATWLTATVGQFKRQYFTHAIDDGRVVRLIYRGQLLRDDARSLESYGLHDNCIVHAHISNTPLSPPASGTAGWQTASRPAAPQRGANGMRTFFNIFSEAREILENIGGGNLEIPDGAHDPGIFQLGRYLNYLFAFKFVLLWVFVFCFPQWVDTFSVLLLVMLTIAYVTYLCVGRLTVVRTEEANEQENQPVINQGN